MNWRLNPKEIAAIVEDAQLKLLFYAEKHLSSLTDIDQNLLHMDIDVAQYDEIVNQIITNLFKQHLLNHKIFAALIYTSGTTGSLKV